MFVDFCLDRTVERVGDWNLRMATHDGEGTRADGAEPRLGAAVGERAAGRSMGGGVAEGAPAGGQAGGRVVDSSEAPGLEDRGGSGGQEKQRRFGGVAGAATGFG